MSTAYGDVGVRRRETEVLELHRVLVNNTIDRTPVSIACVGELLRLVS